ncbi:hypothetical protein NDU88_002453 [Pleurodeles waltl]|uniref:Uncharacterized protein n=1 Tax=Pleurodeles waltl TaxID=8319 RepID=A0AAV7UD86_PLEWA|nr:hypothetical protein NDU88_002453 [Pleurodeles waltl]
MEMEKADRETVTEGENGMKPNLRGEIKRESVGVEQRGARWTHIGAQQSGVAHASAPDAHRAPHRALGAWQRLRVVHVTSHKCDRTTDSRRGTFKTLFQEMERGLRPELCTEPVYKACTLRPHGLSPELYALNPCPKPVFSVLGECSLSYALNPCPMPVTLSLSRACRSGPSLGPPPAGKNAEVCIEPGSKACSPRPRRPGVVVITRIHC